ncbi:MAG: hypothetical protein METHSR3v1_1190005 [Methanothrix sp.]|jgi:hypothetical protein|nr:MAG: hypothetical protein METHSR3v1_1190005 [Methanothrix sp.]
MCKTAVLYDELEWTAGRFFASSFPWDRRKVREILGFDLGGVEIGWQRRQEVEDDSISGRDQNL